MTSRRRTAVLSLGAMLALAVTQATAQTQPAPAPQSRPPINLERSGLAIQGYDPVAYHTLGKPTKGTAEFTVAHDGATYRFASAEHKALFEQEPGKYAPQYGGYCAWAVAHGYTAAIDPRAWHIVDGKLYLNYNASVAKDWSADTPRYIKSGNANWIDWRKLRKG